MFISVDRTWALRLRRGATLASGAGFGALLSFDFSYLFVCPAERDEADKPEVHKTASHGEWDVPIRWQAGEELDNLGNNRDNRIPTHDPEQT